MLENWEPETGGSTRRCQMRSFRSQVCNGRARGHCQGVKFYAVWKLYYSAKAAQARIGLQLVDDRQKVIKANNTLKLEPGPLIA